MCRWARGIALLLATAVSGCISQGPSDRSYGRAQRLLRSDPRLAEAAFQTSCRSESYGPGCTAAARLHASGQGVKQDLALALTLFLDGCHKGDPIGCMELRDRYARGEAERDASPEAEAAFAAVVERYRSGCFSGVAQACLGAGVLMKLGWGTARNGYNGRRLIQKACAMGSPEACAEVDVSGNVP